MKFQMEFFKSNVIYFFFLHHLYLWLQSLILAQESQKCKNNLIDSANHSKGALNGQLKSTLSLAFADHHLSFLHANIGQADA